MVARLHRVCLKKTRLPLILQPEVSTTIMDRSPWDSNAVFTILCFFWAPHETVHPFRNVLTVLTPFTPYKFETWKNL